MDEAARSPAPDAGKADLYPALWAYVSDRHAEIDRIDPGRRAPLDALCDYVRQSHAAGEAARLLFVCTHNSRRSHMAQLWAAAAAEACGVRVRTYSGGTEATAFNPSAVGAMKRAGFRVERTTDEPNPIYHLRYSDKRPALTCFSKKYDDPPNPREDFAAVMVCGEADRACPSVAGATGRFALPFVDPKESDGTPVESATYDECCARIAREMIYIMSRAAR